MLPVAPLLRTADVSACCRGWAIGGRVGPRDSDLSVPGSARFVRSAAAAPPVRSPRLFSAAALGVAAVAGRRQRRQQRRRRTAARAGWHFGSEDADEPELQQQGEYQEEDFEDGEEDGFSQLSTHREMIEDEVRTEAFRKAIFQHCRGKVVLEIGCGTGILSLFAAQAGASRVVAVEANEEVAEFAREVVSSNGFSDVVTVISGRIEDVWEEVDRQLEDENRGEIQADILISEWMGFMLVCDGMFRSVVFARDRWLKEDGLMLPSKCDLWVAPFSNPALIEEQTGYWCSTPYGLNLSALAPRALEQHLSQPVIKILPESGVLATPVSVLHLDCNSAEDWEVDGGRAKFDFTMNRDAPFHGLAAWFSCELGPQVSFSTSPDSRPTHWEQTLLFVGPESPAHELALRAGERVTGDLQWLVSGRSTGVVMVGEVACSAEVVRFTRRLELHLV